MYPVKSPFWLQWSYPSLIWHKNRKEKCIYLTFDDGPIPVVTPFVLSTLEKFNAKATFFCVGDNVAKYRDTYAQVKNAGHAIGNHTYHHLNGWKTDDGIYLENIKKCDQLVSSNLFRPPYGKIKKPQLKKLKMANPKLEVVMWDVLSGDFDQKLSPQKCLNHVVKNVESGSIIVFHDSLKAFNRLEYALPKALEYLVAEGYSFGTL